MANDPIVYDWVIIYICVPETDYLYVSCEDDGNGEDRSVRVEDSKFDISSNELCNW